MELKNVLALFKMSTKVCICCNEGVLYEGLKGNMLIRELEALNKGYIVNNFKYLTLSNEIVIVVKPKEKEV